MTVKWSERKKWHSSFDCLEKSLPHWDNVYAKLSIQYVCGSRSFSLVLLNLTCATECCDACWCANVPMCMLWFGHVVLQSLFGSCEVWFFGYSPLMIRIPPGFFLLELLKLKPTMIVLKACTVLKETELIWLLQSCGSWWEWHLTTWDIFCWRLQIQGSTDVELEEAVGLWFLENTPK